MTMVWVCDKCSTMNTHEVSTYNRVQGRRLVSCNKCGKTHPGGYYTVD